jgi:predicted ATPase
MNRLVKENFQFVIATHSPIILAFPGAVIYQTSDLGIEQGRYEECEHYVLMRQFLDSPQSFIRHLFEEESNEEDS